MPDLAQSLQGRDLGHLKIVASLWGVDFSAPDARLGLPRLAAALLSAAASGAALRGLKRDALEALSDLRMNAGRLPWILFTRRYGVVREMGPAKRDREQPYLDPVSPAESLWYRALIGRAFFDTPSGPEEFAFIPEDMLVYLSLPENEFPNLLGRPASPGERVVIYPASDRLLDHACTLLAALRSGFSKAELDSLVESWNEPPFALLPARLTRVFLVSLLTAAGLLDADGALLVEPVRIFLEVGRGEALARLARTWLESAELNDLRLMPELQCEGEWKNDPLLARRAVIDFLSTVPRSSWWSLAALIAAVRQSAPDFQRPAGDYDSWYVRKTGEEAYLRGFGHWEDVDGALIRFLIIGPLHWLGILDLAGLLAEGISTGQVASFRFSDLSEDLLAGKAPVGLANEDARIQVRSDALLIISRGASRAVRYQLSRFCTWEGENGDNYVYRFTPGALERARQQGLRVSHLMGLLRRYASSVPPNLARALERWDERGSEARVQQATILRLRSTDLLQSLRASRAARFLGEPLGPTAVIVKPGAWKQVLAVLVELGYLGENEVQSERDEDLDGNANGSR